MTYYERPQTRDDIAGRRAWLTQLRSTASHLNHLDTDDFGEDGYHGATVIAWAVDEIMELDRLLAIHECRAAARGDERPGAWDDLECGHNHDRSPLAVEPPRGRTYEQRVAFMAKMWPPAVPSPSDGSQSA